MYGLRQHHLIGMFAGALLGIAVAGLSSRLGYALTFGDGLFWGGVIGGVLAGVPQFVQAGAVLTRSENRALNMLVGVVGGLVVLGVTAMLAVFVTRLLF